MPSKRSRKEKDKRCKKFKEDNHEDDRAKEKKGVQENRKRHFEEKRFKLGEVNSSIITTKRLTVGVKGIFGNGKHSSSAYRDLQDRIKNKKLSKVVASEVQLSLSRIIPSRSYTKSNELSRYSDSTMKDDESLIASSCHSYPSNSHMRTPGNTITPYGSAKVHQVFSSVERCVESETVSSIRNNSAERTPVPLQRTYVTIANSIRNSIPQLKPFKGKDYLGDVKKELMKIYKENRDLPIVPKFRKRDFLQPSQAPDEIPLVAKKVCRKELEKKLQTTFSEGEHVSKSTLQHTKNDNRLVIPPDEKPPNIVLKDLHSINSNNHLERHGFKQTTNRNKENQITKKTARLDCVGCEENKLGDIHIASAFSKDRFSNFLQQPNIQQILRQPISSLRASRKQPISSLGAPGKRPASTLVAAPNQRNHSQKLSSFVNLQHQEPYSSLGKPNPLDNNSDFLDFIDSIPLRALEHQLFGTESSQTVSCANLHNFFPSNRRKKEKSHNTHQRDYYASLIRGDTSISSDVTMSLELQKPILESPSPPKLYRMNMY